MQPALVENPGLVAAFAAGLLSFISPCVLPLIPGYLSYISGVTLDEMESSRTSAEGSLTRRRVLVAAIFFILGFSAVFVSLGAAASVVGEFLRERLSLFMKIAGVVVILFGLHTMGVLRIGWLYSERRVQIDAKPKGVVGAFLVGLAFAFGWTPCIGPILSGILLLAAEQQTVSRGITLLAVYSLGLGVPFLMTALAIDRFFTAFARIRRHYRAIEIASGLLLVVIGVLIFTDRFTIIARWLTPYLPTL
ncbi:MAG TPA: cytochrome c biogenesis protein CcdA [Vicinamibacterales bacterium]